MCFDIVSVLNEIFNSSPISVKDLLDEFASEYNIVKTQIPQITELNRIFDEIFPEDHLELIFSGNEDAHTINKVIDDTDNTFENFINDFLDNDEIKVNIRISKISNNGKLTVYNLDRFTNFLYSLTLNDICIKFTDLFNQCGEHIQFVLLETDEQFMTNSIAFSCSDINWHGEMNRSLYLDKCNDASVFLEKNRIKLFPYDFNLPNKVIPIFEPIFVLFHKIRNVLSYIFIANTSDIIDGNIILQFNPNEKGYDYNLNLATDNNEICNNNIAYEIFNWIFSDDHCIERAKVARNIIQLYCHTSEEILNIDDKILNAIKSNYIIYQKDHVEKYIEMKNKISDFISESSEKIFEISHDISDALRNNFIAVVVFIMSVVLTDHIDMSQIMAKQIPDNFLAVCFVFIVAMFLYLHATRYMSDVKWIQNSYDSLKSNYEGMFDKNDIEDAFKNDSPLKNAEAQYEEIKEKITIIWLALLILLILFAAYLSCHKNGYEAISQ